jgi:hypothetical protein
MKGKAYEIAECGKLCGLVDYSMVTCSYDFVMSLARSLLYILVKGKTSSLKTE